MNGTCRKITNLEMNPPESDLTLKKIHLLKMMLGIKSPKIEKLTPVGKKTKSNFVNTSLQTRKLCTDRILKRSRIFILFAELICSPVHYILIK